MSASLAAGLIAGERRAIARAISAVENDDPQALAVIRAIEPRLGRARVLGITGPPGSGKSTLIDALIGECLARGERVAVVAVDPSSPLTGGAVLGDRIRMGAHQADERVFIRSLASRGHLGGLSRTTGRIVDLLDAAGFGRVIVETVGTGQDEVEVAVIADTRVVVCPPGLGDEVQAMKAGVLEIADIYCINKADLPGVERTERELLGLIDLRHSREWTPRVVRTIATTGSGVADLADAVAAREAGGSGRAARAERLRRLLAAGAADWLRARIETLQSEEIDALCARFGGGGLASAKAWRRAARIALKGEKS